MRILLVGEHNKQGISYETKCAITALSQLKLITDFLIIDCENNSTILNEAKKLFDFHKIFVIQNIDIKKELAQGLEKIILSLLDQYTHVFFLSTTFGRNLAPRIAAKLDVAQISDIIKVVNITTYERHIYACNAIQRIQSTDKKIIITVKSSSFEPIQKNLLKSQESKCVIIFIDANTYNLCRYASLITRIYTDKQCFSLQSSKIIVSGGLGLGSKENFDRLIRPFAKKLNAAVGATRGAVDAGYVTNDLQIGQSGKTVSPIIYFAIGISGAVQHCAGIRDAKVIVAINQDRDAPIFEYATYGIVGDLFFIVPKLSNLCSDLIACT